MAEPTVVCWVNGSCAVLATFGAVMFGVSGQGFAAAVFGALATANLLFSINAMIAAQQGAKHGHTD